MTFENFKSSLDKKNPPENLNQLLLALWYDAKGDWEKSHKLVSDINSKEASLIHAYLHRKEAIWGMQNIGIVELQLIVKTFP